jgi:hypothetical protein
MALDRTPPCVDSPESVRSAVQFSVTRLTQADEVLGVVRFRGRRMVRVEASMMDVQSGAAELATRGTTAVLGGDHSEAQDAPTRAAIGSVSPAPDRRLWTRVTALVSEVARARAELRRVSAVLRAAFHLERFQSEGLLTLRAGKQDRLDPLRIITAAESDAGRVAAGGAPYLRLPVDVEPRDRGAAKALPRAVFFSSQQGPSDQHLYTALLAWLDGPKRRPSPSERRMAQDESTTAHAASDARGVFPACDLALCQMNICPARCTLKDHWRHFIALRGHMSARILAT